MSLGLVAYDSSDESDDNDSTSAEVTRKSPKNHEFSVKNENSTDKDLEENELKSITTVSSCLSGNISDEDDDPTTSSSGASNSMKPELSTVHEQKVTKLHDIDFDWNQLSKNHKSSARSVKISVPSLVDLKDEEDSEPVKKKIKPSKSGSGLFALLPSPKNQFGNQVPRQIARPTAKSPVIKSKPLPSSSATLKSKSVLSLNYDDSADEEEEDTENSSTAKKVDFFSLDAPKIVAAPDVAMPHVDVSLPSLITQPESSETSEHPTVGDHREAISNYPATAHYPDPQTETSNQITYDDACSSTSYIPFDSTNVELDQTALEQLCGRKERQKGAANIQLIDVSGDQILPDSREWLTKQLTEEQSQSHSQSQQRSKRNKDGPTSQQKRKHQITYLAFQAKENELELKNQWANNRLSKKQTQAKYGF
ncbi:proline-rich protein PRCC [Nilaparvata lugens]|uniref:proline-rich protein PRCC n=1 Tax=Nilaparvata lugens TaxID=108931 RepID=UPI00193E6BE8|nr:proline-rich protein PRCC [Nilaparvata lugens]